MGYTRYKKLQKWVSNDNGISWTATEEYKKGDVLGEYDSLLECEGSGGGPNIERGYRWINLDITKDWECFNGSKYYKQQRQYTTDKGQTWHDMDEYRMGSLYELNASDCQNEEPQPPFASAYRLMYSSNTIGGEIPQTQYRNLLYNGYYDIARLEDNKTNEIVSFETDNLYSLYRFAHDVQGLTDITFINRWDCSNVTETIEMFFNCKDLKTVNGLQNFITSNKLKSMKNMFTDCNSLTYFDISGWNTSNVTDMYGLLCNCKSITSIDNLKTLDTRSVTDMGIMFKGCENLKDIDLSGWKTNSVTNMKSMFEECKNLETVNLSGLDVSKVTTFEAMFNNYEKLKMVDLSGWVMNENANVRAMFYAADFINTTIKCSTDVKNKLLNGNAIALPNYITWIITD